jgi:hypothetical protein
MKTLIALSIFVFSFSTFACPDISGSFLDEDGETITIAQTKCESLNWSDSESTTKLIADNAERVVEQEGDNVAYGKARFTDKDFVLELRVVYGKNAPSDWPTHFLTSYRIDKYNNMVEKIESSQGTSYVTFRRVQ